MPFALAEFVQLFGVLLVVALVGVDDLGLELEAQPLDDAVDGLAVADEHGLGDALLGHLVGRADHLLVVALAERHALRVALGLVEDDAHHLAGLPEARLEFLAVVLEVEFAASDARVLGGARDGGRHLEQYARVERFSG